MSDKLKILVVDDDPAIRFVLESYLSEDYDVSSAVDGQQAWDILVANEQNGTKSIDVVLSDMTMPILDGVGLLKRIKSNFPNICVIMISGSGSTRSAIAAIREGAFDFIIKPFNELEILKIIVEKWIKLQSLETKLSQYATLHEDMMQHLKLRTFLSIDVVDSAGMKIGANPFIIQHAFQEYHAFIKECVESNHGIIHSTAGDGIMTCFDSVFDCIAAARQILSSLGNLNHLRNRLKRDFILRLGAHSGSVVVDEKGTINAMFSESLDVAGHIQKNASPNRIEISEDALKILGDHTGFESTGKVVAGQTVYVRTPSA